MGDVGWIPGPSDQGALGHLKGCRVGKAKTMRRQTRKPGRKKLTSRTVSLKAAAWYAKASQSVAIKAAPPR